MYLSLLQKSLDKRLDYTPAEVEAIAQHPEYFPLHGDVALLDKVIGQLKGLGRQRDIHRLLYSACKHGQSALIAPLIPKSESRLPVYANAVATAIEHNQIPTLAVLIDAIEAHRPDQHFRKHLMKDSARQLLAQAFSAANPQRFDFILEQASHFQSEGTSLAVQLLRTIDFHTLMHKMSWDPDSRIGDILVALMNGAERYGGQELARELLQKHGRSFLNNSMTAAAQKNSGGVLALFTAARKLSTPGQDLMAGLLKDRAAIEFTKNAEIQASMQDYYRGLDADKKAALRDVIAHFDNEFEELFTGPLPPAAERPAKEKKPPPSQGALVDLPEECEQQHVRAYCRLFEEAMRYEGEGEGKIRANAIKLATLFKGDVKKADALLQQVADPQSELALANAMRFGLPGKGEWHPTDWGDLLVRLGPGALPYVSLAPYVEKTIAKRNELLPGDQHLSLASISLDELKKIGEMKLYGIAVAGVPTEAHDGVVISCTPIAVAKGDRPGFKPIEDKAFKMTVKWGDPQAQAECFVRLEETLANILQRQKESCEKAGVDYRKVVLFVGDAKANPVDGDKINSLLLDALPKTLAAAGKGSAGANWAGKVTEAPTIATRYAEACRALPDLLKECIWVRGSYGLEKEEIAEREPKLQKETSIDSMLRRQKERIATGQDKDGSSHFSICALARSDGLRRGYKQKTDQYGFQAPYPKGYKESAEMQERLAGYGYHGWHEDYRRAYTQGFDAAYGKDAVEGRYRYVKLPSDKTNPFFTDPCADAVMEQFQIMDGVRKERNIFENREIPAALSKQAIAAAALFPHGPGGARGTGSCVQP